METFHHIPSFLNPKGEITDVPVAFSITGVLRARLMESTSGLEDTFSPNKTPC